MMDVAKLAGVSHQTVSRVVNGHPGVRLQTRSRVEAAISELRYRPNRTARALASGSSHSIGVVAQNATPMGPARLLTSFEKQAASAGFAVTVCAVSPSDSQALAAAVDRHLEQRVAGIVVIAPVASSSQAISRIPPHIAVVEVDGDFDSSSSLVTVDQVGGARMATQLLLDAGHETVWHIAGPADWFDSTGRVRGWQAALSAAHATLPPLVRADWTAASGYRAGQELARRSDVTAIFTGNDYLALGLLRALHESGKQVPRDVSVVGFDDVPEAAYFLPPLTTIRPDFERLASRTLAMLEQLMAAQQDCTLREIVASALVIRDSVAEPPGS